MSQRRWQKITHDYGEIVDARLACDECGQSRVVHKVRARVSWGGGWGSIEVEPLEVPCAHMDRKRRTVLIEDVTRVSAIDLLGGLAS